MAFGNQALRLERTCKGPSATSRTDLVSHGLGYCTFVKFVIFVTFDLSVKEKGNYAVNTYSITSSRMYLSRYNPSTIQLNQD